MSSLHLWGNEQTELLPPQWTAWQNGKFFLPNDTRKIVNLLWKDHEFIIFSQGTPPPMAGRCSEDSCCCKIWSLPSDFSMFAFLSFSLIQNHSLCYCLLWNAALELEVEWCCLCKIRKHYTKSGNRLPPYCPALGAGEYSVHQRKAVPSLSPLFSW